MRNYLDLLNDILINGIEANNRTEIPTKSLFFKALQWDLAQGFPLVTTKKVHFKSIVHELLWFLKGSANIKYLKENNVTIWDEWVDENGNLGPIYPESWRNWEYYDLNDFNTINGVDTPKFKSVDQIQKLIETIKKDPNSRRLVVSAWNVPRLHEMKLMPCHYSFVVSIKNNKLNLQWNQRSADTFLGIPYNIASYALLTHMLAHITGYEPGILATALTDAHLYSNHIDQAKLQLTREPYSLPTLKLNPNIKNIDDFKYEDIVLENYQSHPTIKAPVAV